MVGNDFKSEYPEAQSDGLFVLRYNLSQYLSSAQQTLLLKVFGDNLDGTLDVDFISLDMNLGARRCLIGSGNTSEFYERERSAFQHPFRETRGAPLISPLLAFLYNPFGSLSSTTLNGASTKTSMNGMGGLCASCSCRASCRSET
jgi:hypothetical protein